MVCTRIWPRGWRSEECGWRWFQSGECNICKYLWSRVSSWAPFLIFSTCDTDPSFLSFSSHMVPFNQPEAAVVCLRSFFTFKPTSCLVSHSCLCLFPRLLFWREHALFSKPPMHLFTPPCSYVFLAGSNHPVDHGYSSDASTESGCVGDNGLIPLLSFVVS